MKRKIRSGNRSDVVALPKAITKLLGVGVGDYIEYIIKENGRVEIKAIEKKEE